MNNDADRPIPPNKKHRRDARDRSHQPWPLKKKPKTRHGRKMDSTPVDPTPDDSHARLIDVKTVAAWLACSPRQVRRLADAGKMPKVIKVGHLIRWSAKEIDNWISGGCQPPGH
jgi:predicted DNA-binding transcriptional regulator AlpA